MDNRIRGYGWISSINKEQEIHFDLVETPKGFIIRKNNKNYKKISNSTRNYLWAERKFESIMKDEAKKFIKQHPNKFKEIYSNIFHSPNSEYFTQKEMENMYMRSH